MSKPFQMGACGAVYVEFLIVIMPLLMLFLCLIQLGLLYGAHILVEHAASKTARAAIVILPDTHENSNYQGVPPNQISTGSSGILAYQNAPANGRYDKIRTAARIVLAPLSPGLDSLSSIASTSGDSVAEAIGTHPELAAGLGLAAYTNVAMGVALLNDNGEIVSRVDNNGTVTTKVSFLFRCAVPWARDIMCSRYANIEKSTRDLIETQGSGLGVLASGIGWRFAALEATRSLPNQGAF